MPKIQDQNSARQGFPPSQRLYLRSLHSHQKDIKHGLGLNMRIYLLTDSEDLAEPKNRLVNEFDVIGGLQPFALPPLEQRHCLYMPRVRKHIHKPHFTDCEASFKY